MPSGSISTARRWSTVALDDHLGAVNGAEGLVTQGSDPQVHDPDDVGQGSRPVDRYIASPAESSEGVVAAGESLPERI